MGHTSHSWQRFLTISSWSNLGFTSFYDAFLTLHVSRRWTGSEEWENDTIKIAQTHIKRLAFHVNNVWCTTYGFARIGSSFPNSFTDTRHADPPESVSMNLCSLARLRGRPWRERERKCKKGNEAWVARTLGLQIYRTETSVWRSPNLIIQLVLSSIFKRLYSLS